MTSVELEIPKKHKGAIILFSKSSSILENLLYGKDVRYEAFQHDQHFILKLYGKDAEKTRDSITKRLERVYIGDGFIIDREFAVIGSGELTFERYYGPTCGISDKPLYVLKSDDILDILTFGGPLKMDIFKKIKESMLLNVSTENHYRFECRFGVPLFLVVPNSLKKTFTAQELLKELKDKKAKCQFNPQCLGFFYDKVRKDKIESKSYTEVTFHIKTFVVSLNLNTNKMKVYKDKGKTKVFDTINCNQVNSLRLSFDRYEILDISSFEGLSEFIKGIDLSDEGKVFPKNTKSEKYDVKYVRFKRVTKYQFDGYSVKIQNVSFNDFEEKTMFERTELEIYSKELNEILHDPKRRNKEYLEKEFDKKVPKILDLCEDLILNHNSNGNINPLIQEKNSKRFIYKPVEVTKVKTSFVSKLQSVMLGKFIGSYDFMECRELFSYLSYDSNKNIFTLTLKSDDEIHFNRRSIEQCFQSKGYIYFILNQNLQYYSLKEEDKKQKLERDCLPNEYNYRVIRFSNIENEIKNLFTPKMESFINTPFQNEKAIDFTQLDNDISYLILCLLSFKKINSHQIDKNFISLLNQDKEKSIYSLTNMFHSFEKHYHNPIEMFQRFSQSYEKIDLKTPHYYKMIKKVVITPSQVYYYPPTFELSNRMNRDYDNNEFIRVKIAEEDFTPLKGNYKYIYSKFFNTFEKGLQILDRKFNYLSFSNASLRNMTFWYIDSKINIDIYSFGEFEKIKNIPKLSSRIGLLFSSSFPSIILKDSDYIIEDDIIKNGRNFSDGIGRISYDALNEVIRSLSLDKNITAIQIRFGGAKGVLVLDPELKSHKVVFRKSQVKFNSKLNQLEIIKVSHYSNAYLNKEIMFLLDSLEIKGNLFYSYFKDQIDLLTKKKYEHLFMLSDYSRRFLPYLDKIKKNDPFFIQLLNSLYSFCINDLHNYKLYIKDGVTLLGVIDETNELEKNEIFVQVRFGNYVKVIEGDVMVFRNPSLHPGDIRILKAVNKQNLHHLNNVCVFSTKGDVPISLKCSGGDFDGDDYTIIWDERLIPKKEEDFFDYDKLKPTNPQETEDITKSKMIDWIFEYAMNDNLGKISNAHLVNCDQKGAKDKESIELAIQHSIAVDFPKTGIPGKIEKIPYFTPNWMNKNHNTYSSSFMDKCFKLVSDVNCPLEKYKFNYQDFITDNKFICEGYKEYLEDAKKNYITYRELINSMMVRYGFDNEYDLLILNFISNKKKESVKSLTFELITYNDEFLAMFNSMKEEEAKKRASAWFVYSYQQESFVSFGWIAIHFLLKDFI